NWPSRRMAWLCCSQPVKILLTACSNMPGCGPALKRFWLVRLKFSATLWPSAFSVCPREVEVSKQEGLELGMLMDSARRFLAGRREGILRGSCSDSEGAAALWRECAELGWLLTCVPPDADGAGMGTSALAI